MCCASQAASSVSRIGANVAAAVARIAGGDVTEVILATNPNVEGETTALYLARLLKPFGMRVTRIAVGVPVGSELEYVDLGTIAHALVDRR